MVERLLPVFGTCMLLASFGWAAPAAAQSTNATPVLIEGTTAIDPTSLPLPPDGQKAITDAVAALKAGTIVAHVTVGTPDGKTWQTEQVAKSNFINVADLTRQGLETCEYVASGPCLVFEIDGHDAREASGGWPTQPRMLDNQGGSFDNWRVPFVTLNDRVALGGYNLVSGPRALVITTVGGWTWSGGTTIFDAISKALAAAQKANGPTATYLLYAVGNQVVFTP